MVEPPAVSDRDNAALSVRMRPTRVGLLRTQAHLLPRGEVDDLPQSKRTEKAREDEQREDVKARLPPERG